MMMITMRITMDWISLVHLIMKCVCVVEQTWGEPTQAVCVYLYTHAWKKPSQKISQKRKPKFEPIDKFVYIYFYLFGCNWMKIIFIRLLKCLPNFSTSPLHCLIEWNHISFVCCNFYLFTITKKKEWKSQITKNKMRKKEEKYFNISNTLTHATKKSKVEKWKK